MQDQRRDLLTRIAKMYYLEDKSQAEIGRALHMSRSNISKLLKASRDQGIVEIRIRENTSLGSILKEKLEARFDLESCAVIPAVDDAEQTKMFTGRKAAEVLEERLADGVTLGISWGSSVYYTVQAFQPSRPYRSDVVQMMGGVGSRNLLVDGFQLAFTLSSKLDGACYVLQAPLIVQSGSFRGQLLKEPDVQSVFRRFADVDIALIGLGSNYPDSSGLVRAGYLSTNESRHLVDQGVVGNIMGRHLTLEGKPSDIPLNERVVGIELDQLLKIPVRIGLASGAEKGEILLSALRGGYINSLVADESVIVRLLEIVNPQSDG